MKKKINKMENFKMTFSYRDQLRKKLYVVFRSCIHWGIGYVGSNLGPREKIGVIPRKPLLRNRLIHTLLKLYVLVYYGGVAF